MKSLLVIVAFLLTGITASAYKDGTYQCVSGEKFPPNVYKISTVEVTPGIRVPFVEITYYFELEKDVISSSNTRGFATAFASEGIETLTLGNAHLEFSGDTLNRCKKP